MRFQRRSLWNREKQEYPKVTITKAKNLHNSGQITLYICFVQNLVSEIRQAWAQKAALMTYVFKLN